MCYKFGMNYVLKFQNIDIILGFVMNIIGKVFVVVAKRKKKQMKLKH